MTKKALQLAPRTPGTFRTIAPRPALTPACSPLAARSPRRELDTPSRINSAEDSPLENTEGENASILRGSRVVNAVYRIRPVAHVANARTQSEIWDHGTLVEIEEWNKDTNKLEWNKRWQCNVCQTKFYKPSGTRHAHNHLKSHGINTNSLGKTMTPNDPSLNVNTMTSTSSRAEQKRALVMWIAVDHIPFVQTESIYFQKFLSSVNV